MLLESVFETLRRIENERLQLPIFYESPIALRFETLLSKEIKEKRYETSIKK